MNYDEIDNYIIPFQQIHDLYTIDTKEFVSPILQNVYNKRKIWLEELLTCLDNNNITNKYLVNAWVLYKIKKELVFLFEKTNIYNSLLLEFSKFKQNYIFIHSISKLLILKYCYLLLKNNELKQLLNNKLLLNYSNFFNINDFIKNVKFNEENIKFNKIEYIKNKHFIPLYIHELIFIHHLYIYKSENKNTKELYKELSLVNEIFNIDKEPIADPIFRIT